MKGVCYDTIFYRLYIYEKFSSRSQDFIVITYSKIGIFDWGGSRRIFPFISRRLPITAAATPLLIEEMGGDFFVP